MAACLPNLFPNLPDLKGDNAVIRPSAPPCSAQSPNRGPNAGKIPPPFALLTRIACPQPPPSFICSLPPLLPDIWLSRFAPAPTRPPYRLWPPSPTPTIAPLHPPLPPRLPQSSHTHPVMMNVLIKEKSSIIHIAKNCESHCLRQSRVRMA